MFSENLILNKITREKYDLNLKKSLHLRNHLIKKNIFVGKNCTFFICAEHSKKNANQLVKAIISYIN